MGACSRWALIRGWALIKVFCLQDGRLFEVGANSRLGAYWNKYGMYIPQCIRVYTLALFCSCVVFVLLFLLFCGLAVHAKFDSTVFLYTCGRKKRKQLFDQKNLS